MIQKALGSLQTRKQKANLLECHTPSSPSHNLAQKSLAWGIFWCIAAMGVSNLNDVFMKLLGARLESPEIAFFRFFWGLITVLPVMLFFGRSAFKVHQWSTHTLRTVLGCLALFSWSYAVTHVDLTVVTTIGFTVPLFVLPFATLLLKEQIDMRRWLVTLMGFLGILVVFHPRGAGFTPASIALLLSSIVFAFLDTISKKMVMKESMVTIVFYFGVGSTVLCFIPALSVWKTPTHSEMFFLFLLGIGSNLIQYCILKSFTHADLSVLAPFRYVELIFSAFFGWFLFSEPIRNTTLLGALMIIPATLYLAYHEMRTKKSKKG